MRAAQEVFEQETATRRGSCSSVWPARPDSIRGVSKLLSRADSVVAQTELRPGDSMTNLPHPLLEGVASLGREMGFLEEYIWRMLNTSGNKKSWTLVGN